MSLQQLLDEKATAEPVGAHGLVALDWAGGNRSVLVDGRLSGAIVGLTLATTAPEIYRALLESTAFGTRMIIDTFGASGVPVTELVVAGGLIKSAPLMQIYADVTRRTLSVIGSGQGPALGSAIHAAVAAGAYPDVPAAAAAMGQIESDVYRPDRPERTCTTSCTPSTCSCTTISGAGRTRSCTGCAPSATGLAGGAGHERAEKPAAHDVLKKQRLATGFALGIATLRNPVSDLSNLENGIGFGVDAFQLAGALQRCDPLAKVVERQRISPEIVTGNGTLHYKARRRIRG